MSQGCSLQRNNRSSSRKFQIEEGRYDSIPELVGVIDVFLDATLVGVYMYVFIAVSPVSGIDTVDA